MIKSVKKAMDILTILSGNAETPMTLSELAEKTGLNKSTCAHIIDTMCDSLYVERVSRKEGYRLGPWAYMLSRYGAYNSSLIKVATPIIKWLHSQTGASAFISVVTNGRKYIIYHIDKEGILPMSDGSIIQGYMEATATGRILLAYMDSEALHYTIARMSEEEGRSGAEILDNELKAELKKIRAAGYAHCSVEMDQTESFAFPVNDGSKVIASVGVLYSKSKDSEEYREKIVKQGRMAANEISHRLAFK